MRIVSRLVSVQLQLLPLKLEAENAILQVRSNGSLAGGHGDNFRLVGLGQFGLNTMIRSWWEVLQTLEPPPLLFGNRRAGVSAEVGILLLTETLYLVNPVIVHGSGQRFGGKLSVLF